MRKESYLSTKGAFENLLRCIINFWWLPILATWTAFSTEIVQANIMNWIGPARFDGLWLVCLNGVLVFLGLIVSGLVLYILNKQLSRAGKNNQTFVLGFLALIFALIASLSANALDFMWQVYEAPYWVSIVAAGITFSGLPWSVGKQIQELGDLRSMEGNSPGGNTLEWGDQTRDPQFPDPDQIRTVILAMSTKKNAGEPGIWETFAKDIEGAKPGVEARVWAAFQEGYDFGTDAANKEVYGEKESLRENVKQSAHHISKHPWVQPLRLLSLLLRKLGATQDNRKKNPKLNIHVFVADEWYCDLKSRNKRHSSGCGCGVEIPDFLVFKTILEKACRSLGREAEITLLKDADGKYISHYDWDRLEIALTEVINKASEKKGVCIVDITGGTAAFSAAAAMACLQTTAKISYLDGMKPEESNHKKSKVYLRRNFREISNV